MGFFRSRQVLIKSLRFFTRMAIFYSAVVGIALALSAHPILAGEHEITESGRHESKFYGTVDNLPQDLIGIWVVNGRQIVVTRDTRIKKKHGRPEPGAYVEVEGSNTGLKFTASVISVKRAKQQ